MRRAGDHDHGHPQERHGFSKLDFAPLKDAPPSEDKAGEENQRPRKPPGEMQGQELPARNVIVIAENPVLPVVHQKAMKQLGIIMMGPEIPGGDEDEKEKPVIPSEQRAKPLPRLAITSAEKPNDREQIEKAGDAFR